MHFSGSVRQNTSPIVVSDLWSLCWTPYRGLHGRPLRCQVRVCRHPGAPPGRGVPRHQGQDERGLQVVPRHPGRLAPRVRGQVLLWPEGVSDPQQDYGGQEQREEEQEQSTTPHIGNRQIAEAFLCVLMSPLI